MYSIYSNYSSLDALGSSAGGKTEGDPICSTEEESLLEEKESSGDSDVALGQHSTTG